MEGPLNKENNMPNQFDPEVPTKISPWTKIKNFLLQEISIELTPRQQEIYDSINNFWHQEIDEEEVHNFLFQKMEF